MPMASSETPSARKAPVNTTSSKSRSTPGSASKPRKRKVKTEDTSPKQATSRGRKKSVAASAPEIETVPKKRQKVDQSNHTVTVEHCSSHFPPAEPQLQTLMSQHHQLPMTPYETPQNSPNPEGYNDNIGNQSLHQYATPQSQGGESGGESLNQQLHAGLQGNGSGIDNFKADSYQLKHLSISQESTSIDGYSIPPAKVPHSAFDQLIIKASPRILVDLGFSRNEVIKSDTIDRLTYKIWSHILFLGQGQLMSRMNQFGSTMSELKLRTLARLNFLPSWWFLRERIVVHLKNVWKKVDDSVCELQFREAARETKDYTTKYDVLRGNHPTADQTQRTAPPLEKDGI